MTGVLGSALFRKRCEKTSQKSCPIRSVHQRALYSSDGRISAQTKVYRTEPRCKQQRITFWLSRYINLVGPTRVGDANGNLTRTIARHSHDDRIDCSLRHLGRALHRPRYTSRSECARSGERYRGFDNSQSRLLGNGCGFSNGGIRNCYVPASTDPVEKWRDEWPF